MKTIWLLILVCLGACTEQEPARNSPDAGRATPVVIASNYPLFFFAQQVAGDAVDVRFPDIAGDPATWLPSGDQIVELQAADMIILNGAGYEAWLGFVTVPEDRILDTTADLADQLLLMDATVHQHGPEGEHSHPGTAFTTWLDPLLAIEQARAIEQALSTLSPAYADQINARFTQLEARLQKLERSLQRVFSDLQGQPVVFSHPVYQYLQSRYGINGRSVHWESDEDPGTRAWIDFQNLLRVHASRLMIWEGQPLPEVRARLEEMGIRTVVFQVAGNRTETGDYLSLMQDNLARLVDTLSQLPD